MVSMPVHTRLLPTGHPQALETALKVLHSGGLVAFPTDTVYGVAALVHDPQAIDRLYEVKGRDAAKAIPVLIGETQQLAQITLEFNPCARLLAGRFWPGALTLIVPRHPSLPANLSPLSSVGVRMPDHPFARALLRRCGPLATTSANLSGQPSPCTAQETLAQLGGRIELVLDGGRCPGGIPSTVVDCTTAQPAILRTGALSPAEIEQVFRSPSP